jgi:hypothetical protein
MQELDSIRKLAASTISNAEAFADAEKGARLLELALEIERKHAEVQKLAAERRKFDKDADNSTMNSDRLRFYVTLLTPLISTIVLAGTLALQTKQFTELERDKQDELASQRTAAEDSRWDDAIKTLAQSDKLTAANALLKRFLTGRYANPARDEAYQLLVRSEPPEAFQDLFGAVFLPASRSTLPRIVELNTALNEEYGDVANRRDRQHLKLSTKDEEKYQTLRANIRFTGVQMAPALRTKRAAADPGPDLRGIAIWDCDWSNTDLTAANIANTALTRVVLRGADLTGITGEKFSGTTWESVAWWQALRVSPDLLCYMRKWPFYKHGDYGDTTVSKGEYDTNLKRLSETIKCDSTATAGR